MTRAKRRPLFCPRCCCFFSFASFFFCAPESFCRFAGGSSPSGWALSSASAASRVRMVPDTDPGGFVVSLDTLSAGSVTAAAQSVVSMSSIKLRRYLGNVNMILCPSFRLLLCFDRRCARTRFRLHGRRMSRSTPRACRAIASCCSIQHVIQFDDEYLRWVKLRKVLL